VEPMVCHACERGILGWWCGSGGLISRQAPQRRPRAGDAGIFDVAGVDMGCIFRGVRFVRGAAATTPAHDVRTAGAFDLTL
jgi:hypothetical protein